MPIPRPSIAAALCSLSLAAVTFGDAPTTRPMPLRTVTVGGSAHEPFSSGDANGLKRADLASYEAALADAKDRAARAAKVLGVTLGPPVTVEGVQAYETDGTPGQRVEFKNEVKIVFELREP